MDLKNDYLQSSDLNVLNNHDVFNVQLDLMHLLDSTNTPLYLYDKLLVWIKKYVIYNKKILTSFSSNDVLSNREQALHLFKLQTNKKQIEPLNRSIYLPGSKKTINIVLHDFKACLYMFLMDDTLMKEENLLINENILGLHTCLTR